MNELENKLRTLKLRKPMLFYDIESLSEVNEKTFAEFGKNEAEILKIEKQPIRATVNDIE